MKMLHKCYIRVVVIKDVPKKVMGAMVPAKIIKKLDIIEEKR